MTTLCSTTEHQTSWGVLPNPFVDYFKYELSISFNRKMAWSAQEKKTIVQLLHGAYNINGAFREKMTAEYNIVHVVKEIHTTEAGRHFNIQLCHNPLIAQKPRFMTEPGTISSTIHCRVCKDMETGQLYIAKCSQIVEWL